MVFPVCYSKPLITHPAAQHLLQLRLPLIFSLDSLDHDLVGIRPL